MPKISIVNRILILGELIEISAIDFTKSGAIPLALL